MVVFFLQIVERLLSTVIENQFRSFFFQTPVIDAEEGGTFIPGATWIASRS